MTLKEIINFLKNDIKGLMILGIATSIIASLLYDIAKKQVAKFRDKLEQRKKENRLRRLLTSYSNGFRAGYANKSTYQQAALIGDFIIRTIVLVGWTVFISMTFTALLVLFGQPYSSFFVVAFSFTITIYYRKLRDHLGYYKLFMEQVFGEDFKKAVNASMREYLKKKTEDAK
jgi:hypothetical protein